MNTQCNHFSCNSVEMSNKPKKFRTVRAAGRYNVTGYVYLTSTGPIVFHVQCWLLSMTTVLLTFGVRCGQ